LNLGKIILFSVFLCQLVLAEGVSFQVSSTALTTQTGTTNEDGDPESNLINDLKYLAVSNWLQSYLGNRYTLFDKYVTPEFAEKYILDYKVSRANPSGGIDLVGHLDGDSLKKWVRLVESKTKGSNQIKPLWIVSSNLPGLSVSPRDTANKLNNSSTLQLLSQLTQAPLQKLNSKLIPADSSINLEAPPKNSSEIQSLCSLAARQGQTLVIWEAFTACGGCSTPRFDIFVYNTQTQLLSFVVGDDLSLPTRDLSNPDAMKRNLAPIFQQFQNEWENAFSEGSIQEVSYRIVLENVDSYRTLKLLEGELSRGNGFGNPTLKKVASKTAEYEIKSTLSVTEVGQRLQETQLPGVKTQVSKVDSSTLSVKLIR